MGIIKHVGERIIKSTIADQLADTLDKATKKIDKMQENQKAKERKKIDNWLDVRPENYHFIIGKKQYSLKETLYVYNPDETVRYIVKGTLSGIKRHLKVYLPDGKTNVASIKENLLSIRNPLSLDKDPIDFDFYVDERKAAHLKSVKKWNKLQYYQLQPQNWILKTGLLQHNIEVLNEYEETILWIERKWWTIEEAYYIDFSDTVDELLAILFTLAVYVIVVPYNKNAQVKATMKHIVTRSDVPRASDYSKYD